MLVLIATQGQLLIALDAVRAGPSHPNYPWGFRFLRDSSKSALRAFSDPKERTRKATETRQTAGEDRRRRARAWKAQGLKVEQICERVAEEDERRDQSGVIVAYHPSVVYRWLSAKD